MPKEYVFEFLGTKEMFIDMLKQFYHHNGEFYYIDEYIVRVLDNEIHFGVERCGHTAGNWFIARITEFDDRIGMFGKIEYISPAGKRSAIAKMVDRVENVLLFIFLLPIVLVVKAYQLIEWCIRKVCKRPKPKAPTTEDKLYDLMENRLGCIRREILVDRR